MKLTPLNDNVIILRDEADKESKGGIIMPDVAREQKPRRGKILAVGPGAWSQPNSTMQAGKLANTRERLPMTLKAGQRVLYAAYSGNEVEDDGKTYVAIAEDKVLAVITEEE